jgi:PAS domain-containing protein
MVRRVLMLGSVLLVMLAFAGFFLGATILVYRPFVARLTAIEMQKASQQVESAVDVIFTRIESVAKRNRRWGMNGLIDLAQVNRINALLRPVAESDLHVSSMVIADETGREILSVLKTDGTWMNRLTNPALSSGKGRFLTWRGDTLIDDAERETDYDARQRPWFKEAMALADDGAVAWTGPYVFRSTMEPGLSAVVGWLGPDGLRYAMSTDITLLDLTRVTQRIVLGRSGLVAMLSDSGRVIALPRDPRLDDSDSIKAVMLDTVGGIGVAPLTRAYDEWQRLGGQTEAPITVDVGGNRWLARFFPSHHGKLVFWIATLAPANEFAVVPPVAFAVLASLLVAILIMAGWSAGWIATKLTRPLELVVTQSQRIGEMRLDEANAIASPIHEIDVLARSQEAMRISLLQANAAMEEKAILERQLSENRLRALEEKRQFDERFKTVVENSPLAMALVENDGTISYVNRKFTRILGYGHEDLPTLDIWWKRAYPDDAYRAEVVAQWTAQAEKKSLAGRRD